MYEAVRRKTSSRSKRSSGGVGGAGGAGGGSPPDLSAGSANVSADAAAAATHVGAAGQGDSTITASRPGTPAAAPGPANGAGAPSGTRGDDDDPTGDEAAAASFKVNETLYSFKLLDALRSGDAGTLEPFLQRARTQPTKVTEMTSPLHLAMRCAEDSTIASILQHSSYLNINASENQYGNTPLHLASLCGRAEPVKLLLAHGEIDDMARNHAGYEPMEVAATPAIASLFQVSRAELNATYLQALSAYEHSADQSQAVYELLKLNRYRALDLNAQSPTSGATLLHVAITYKDTRMIEFAASKGADVFANDSRGRQCMDATKDERLRALLRQLGNTDPQLLLGSREVHTAPSFKGWLGKWTNLAGRYKPRWFVLAQGLLSYYHSPADEGKQVRGSINLRYATVVADHKDHLRFEVLSEPSGKKGVVGTKLFLRGAHPAERARWVQLLHTTQQYLREHPSDQPTTASAAAGAAPVPSPMAPSNWPKNPSQVGTPAPQLAPAPAPAPASASAVHDDTTSLRSYRSSDTTGSELNPLTPVTSNTGSSKLSRVVSGLRHVPAALTPSKSRPASPAPSSAPAPASTRPMSMTAPSVASLQQPEYEESLLDGDDRSITTTEQPLPRRSSGAPNPAQTLPLNNEVTVLSNALKTRAGLAKSLADLMVANPSVTADEELNSTCTAMRDDIAVMTELLVQYQSVIERRETYLLRRYSQEISAKLLWEENLKTLAKQYEEQERHLSDLQADSSKKRRIIRELRTSGTGSSEVPTIRSGGGIARASAGAGAGAGATAAAAEDEEDEDDKDEFYDAVERGVNVVAEPELTGPPQVGRRSVDFRQAVTKAGIEPYEHVRSTLPIGKDVRPSVSLWAVLRNNIGKDLTKISFPVSFNEPTSMLQRMAEDMEFSECLDAASKTEDSTKRIAYVAAFAMSNYSSTIGRIAKPFNPMLGETFEYIHTTKEYRYYSEQVSHHPPISACFAESQGWQYFGCVDAKSKFLGRTFEIRPTGVAHANLKIPLAWAQASWTPEELERAEKCGDDMVMEHYTWNKVITSVSGFLYGSPTIDHYGDMCLTNHRTGDTCTLSFQPRGWRSKDAFGITGTVMDASGRTRWEIAGRWNSQLVARRVGAGSGELNPDHAVPQSEPIGQAPPAKEAQHLLLWKNSYKPPTPFNLTPFGITLNDLPEGLRWWLPPTDCRLRPDLRAFETGKFDEANSLKIGLEELQRATRKKREVGELRPHKPRWFSRSQDPDTQDTLWAPHKADNGKGRSDPEYWVVRDQVGSARVQKHDPSAAEWPETEHIFGSYEVSA